MEDKIKNIENEMLKEVESAKNRDGLEQVRIKYLGRKGLISEILSSLGGMSVEEKRKVGPLANSLKINATAVFQEKARRLEKEKTKEEGIDFTLPGARPEIGRIHPLIKTINEINEIFIGLGFRIVESPEIETEFYNFKALNIPLDHPSRDVFDTFYLDSPEKTRPGSRRLLRSHTSTAQIRIMEKEKPPLQVLSSGRVFRPDAVDASHSFMFHQMEGFMINKNIRFSDLKGVLTQFSREMFGPETKMRFRPHFFPFTEPSVEIDISCIICGGKGCRVCGNKGWLEILGAGMINPKVYETVGYDPKAWSGFAFGMGIERITMLKYGIDDIRLFFENDLRFLRQF
ncbi:MAG: phenylalanine--tRNA ligase subunit alpha [Candidatus Omnitrophica bacterium CG07_land_8_20_14_0_80_42_15]|uniref:Phenylalanine--tRNA ligase alpha subunit n=1 Tax=Candidatus Aquitaenariimonas noxiae TaxID=1974741 RepID=A0A2J0KX72_9BACT|nr:MAG: phenylalanine--tRNA ligase subunit alpha [Candidatus Omnitrophica bacterium CG07_land_8_20_14_0_80_42_15]